MLRLSLVGCLMAGPALAEAPRVMTDFLPVHSLTAIVMEGVGTPDLLLEPGTDPHNAALTPSDAGRMADADVMIWIGAGLTPWLAAPVQALAGDALHLELLQTTGWTQLPLTHEKDHSEDVGHDDHADHDEHDSHAGHDHGDFDPHAWLDPEIAAIWLATIADTLAEIDPDNAEAYRANAQAGAKELMALSGQITDEFQSLANVSYIVPHDGYRYFEARFGLTNAGSIAISDASAPGPARIAALRDGVVAGNVTCILTDLETDPAWATLLTEGTDARTAQIDGTGAGLEPGPEAYMQIIQTMANSFADCLRNQ